MNNENNDDPLMRFVEAQARDYETALAEIRAGEKLSHWIWYIFPQLNGLGHSSMCKYYGIKGFKEAKAYLANDILGSHLREISRALLLHKDKSAYAILGSPDDLKVRSSMTLFDAVEPNSVFAEVLDAFYEGKRDEKTLLLIRN